jgi:hypothetical protein
MRIEEEDKIKMIQMIDNKLQMLEQETIKITQNTQFLKKINLEMVPNSQLTERKFIFLYF